MFNRLQTERLPISLAACFIILTACSKEEASKTESTQVAAKVNNGEVTVHQLNYELSLAAANNKNLNTTQATPVLLERLINQELLIQKAQERELDRKPAVMQAMERAKRQVMAQAYLEDIFAGLPEPSESEMTKYYDEHPDLFKNRKIYQFQEIVFDPATNKDEIAKRVSEAKDIRDLSEWVRKNNIKVQARAMTSAAERLPIQMLPMISKTPDNRGIFITGTGLPTVLWKVASKDMPMTYEQSTEAIKQYLIKTKRQERAQQEIELQRKVAKIDYKGQFAKPESDVATSKEALPLSDPHNDKTGDGESMD